MGAKNWNNLQIKWFYVNPHEKSLQMIPHMTNFIFVQAELKRFWLTLNTFPKQFLFQTICLHYLWHHYIWHQINLAFVTREFSYTFTWWNLLLELIFTNFCHFQSKNLLCLLNSSSAPFIKRSALLQKGMTYRLVVLFWVKGLSIPSLEITVYKSVPVFLQPPCTLQNENKIDKL